MFGDLNLEPKTYAKHWVFRILCLIIVPVLVYMWSFKVHFSILNMSGDGDANMSSLFQANLEGNDVSQYPLGIILYFYSLEIAYGSQVTIKNYARGGALLHSHVQKFPEGSGQQQVTLYHHKDSNNDWIIDYPWGVNKNYSTGEIEFLKHGDLIRLRHNSTGKNLHAHKIPAPLTTDEYEVSGYGNTTIGDESDIWRIEWDHVGSIF